MKEVFHIKDSIECLYSYKCTEYFTWYQYLSLSMMFYHFSYSNIQVGCLILLLTFYLFISILHLWTQLFKYTISLSNTNDSSLFLSVVQIVIMGMQNNVFICTGIICMLQQISPSVINQQQYSSSPPFILVFFSGFPTTLIVKNNNPTAKETIEPNLKIHPSHKYLYVITIQFYMICIVYTLKILFFLSEISVLV